VHGVSLIERKREIKANLNYHEKYKKSTKKSPFEGLLSSIAFHYFVGSVFGSFCFGWSAVGATGAEELGVFGVGWSDIVNFLPCNTYTRSITVLNC